MNKLFLLILLILPLVLISQKNFTSDIEKGSYSKVIKKSEKLLLKESENIESLYFIAVIKSRKSAGKHYNPLDAYHYAIKSQNLFKNVQDFKSLEFFNKIPISYNKFVELLDRDEYKVLFPLLKSRDKIVSHDVVWKEICEKLGWEFLRTI